MNEHDEQSDKKNPARPHGFGRVMSGILSGALGVQSSKRREEDFASQSPWTYIAAALLFTAGFILTLLLIVNWVLSG